MPILDQTLGDLKKKHTEAYVKSLVAKNMGAKATQARSRRKLYLENNFLTIVGFGIFAMAWLALAAVAVAGDFPGTIIPLVLDGLVMAILVGLMFAAGFTHDTELYYPLCDTYFDNECALMAREHQCVRDYLCSVNQAGRDKLYAFDVLHMSYMVDQVVNQSSREKKEANCNSMHERLFGIAQQKPSGETN
jgi:hypothetical protein